MCEILRTSESQVSWHVCSATELINLQIYLEQLEQPRNFPIPNSETYDKFVRLLVESNKKFLGAHTQLLKRLHGIQYSKLPIVTDFCHGSGLDHIQWSRRYESYLKQMDGLVAYTETIMQQQGFRDFITVRFCNVSSDHTC